MMYTSAVFFVKNAIKIFQRNFGPANFVSSSSMASLPSLMFI